MAPHPGTQNAAVQAWSLNTKEAEREDPWVLASLVQEASPRILRDSILKIKVESLERWLSGSENWLVLKST